MVFDVAAKLVQAVSVECTDNTKNQVQRPKTKGPIKGVIMNDILRDIRFGIRMMANKPAITIIVTEGRAGVSRAE